MRKRSLQHCAFPDCTRRAVAAKGYCWGHYKQLRMGVPLVPLRPYFKMKTGHTRRSCCVKDCRQKARVRLYCSRHYYQYVLRKKRAKPRMAERGNFKEKT